MTTPFISMFVGAIIDNGTATGIFRSYIEHTTDTTSQICSRLNTLVLSAFSDYHDTSYIDTASSELKVWDAFQLGQVGFNRPPWYGCGYATCKYSCTGCAGHYYVDNKGHGSYYWGLLARKVIMAV